MDGHRKVKKRNDDQSSDLQHINMTYNTDFHKIHTHTNAFAEIKDYHHFPIIYTALEVTNSNLRTTEAITIENNADGATNKVLKKMVFPLHRHFGLYEDLGLCVIPYEMVCVKTCMHLFPCQWELCVHAHSVRKRLLVTFSQCLLKWNVPKLLGQLLRAGLLMAEELCVIPI